jgi:hypothetical protein
MIAVTMPGCARHAAAPAGDDRIAATRLRVFRLRKQSRARGSPTCPGRRPGQNSSDCLDGANRAAWLFQVRRHAGASSAMRLSLSIRLVMKYFHNLLEDMNRGPASAAQPGWRPRRAFTRSSTSGFPKRGGATRPACRLVARIREHSKKVLVETAFRVRAGDRRCIRIGRFSLACARATRIGGLPAAD